MQTIEHQNKCIYCNTSHELCRKAHLLPLGLGAFENQRTLKHRVCSPCDSEIGKCEEQLIKCGPEAILRIALGIKGRSGSRSTSPLRRSHAGQEALQFKVPYPDTDYEVLAEPIPGTRNWQPLPQIVIIAPNGECRQILVTEGMTPEELERRVSSTGIKGKVIFWPIAGIKEEQDRVVNLFNQTKFSSGEYLDLNIRPCNEPAKLIGTIRVDKRYFRAIAKIAFHYFLAYYDGFDGSELVFDPIRRFIRYGNGKIEFFVRQERGNLVSDLDKGYRPKYYGHFLIGNVDNQKVMCFLQLFIGRDIDPLHYVVFLGRNPRNILLPTETFGHFYSYLEPDKRKGYAGTMQKLGVSSRIIIPNPSIL